MELIYIYTYYINSQWGLGRVTKLGSLNSHAWSLFHLHVIHVYSNWRYQHCSSKRILKNAAVLTWRYWHISVILGQRFIWWSDQNDPCVPSGPTAFGSRISAGVSCKNNISFFKSNEGRNSETHSKAGSQLSSVAKRSLQTWKVSQIKQTGDDATQQKLFSQARYAVHPLVWKRSGRRVQKGIVRSTVWRCLIEYIWHNV